MRDERMTDRDGTHLETGEMRRAFAAVVAELEQARRESTAYNRQLLQRNRELAATAAIAQATSTGEMDLAAMLERALQVVLEVTGRPAGWILLVPEVGGAPVMVTSAGLTMMSLRICSAPG
jgi:hypothetical protein